MNKKKLKITAKDLDKKVDVLFKYLDITPSDTKSRRCAALAREYEKLGDEAFVLGEYSLSSSLYKMAKHLRNMSKAFTPLKPRQKPKPAKRTTVSRRGPVIHRKVITYPKVKGWQ